MPPKTYGTSHLLSENTGNNSFHYKQRLQGGTAQLTIPQLKEFSSFSDIQQGKNIVFEELDSTGKKESSTGLAYLYFQKRASAPLYIMDNHNHALYAWIKHSPQDKHIEVAHIDAHADMGDNSHEIQKQYCNNEEYLRDLINNKCTIANFIPPYLKAHNAHCSQIRTEYALMNYTAPSNKFFILDIDIDFWALEKNIPTQQQQQLTTLLQQANLITIATSPLFIDQTKAFKLLSQIIGNQSET